MTYEETGRARGPADQHHSSSAESNDRGRCGRRRNGSGSVYHLPVTKRLPRPRDCGRSRCDPSSSHRHRRRGRNRRPPIDPQRVQDQQDDDVGRLPSDPRSELGRPAACARARFASRSSPSISPTSRSSSRCRSSRTSSATRRSIRSRATRWRSSTRTSWASPARSITARRSTATGWSSRAARWGSRRSTPSGRTGCRRTCSSTGLNEYGQAGGCPGRLHVQRTGWSRTSTRCGRRTPAPTSSRKYDIVLRIYAGYDETSVWQEFGEMKFASKDDIPAEWGNPDTTKPRWVPTRYVPWTTWKAGRAAVGTVVGAAGRELRHDHARDRALRVPHRRQQQQSRTPRRTGGSDRARGTSWTADRSTAPAVRTGAGSCRPPKARRCRPGSCCATACATSSLRAGPGADS